MRIEPLSFSFQHRLAGLAPVSGGGGATAPPAVAQDHWGASSNRGRGRASTVDLDVSDGPDLPRVPAGKALPTAGARLKVTPVGRGFHVTGSLPRALRRDLGPNAAARAAWQEMRQAAARSGVSIDLIIDYRSFALQRRLFNKSDRSGKWVAPPGASEHHTGLAFDFSAPGYARRFGKSPAYRWLKENAYRFGFVQSMTYEPWHWRFDPQGVQESLAKAGKGATRLEVTGAAGAGWTPQEMGSGRAGRAATDGGLSFGSRMGLDLDSSRRLPVATMVPVANGVSASAGVSALTRASLEAFRQGEGADWQTMAFASPANGGREVVVAVPPGVDLQRPVEVVTYFHGLYTRVGNVLAGATTPGSTDGNMAAAIAAMVQGPPRRNAIFVLPEMHAGADYARQATYRQGNGQWMGRGESVAGIADEAIARLSGRQGRPVRVAGQVVVGHSFGGKAILNALQAGTMPAGAHVVVADGTYWSGLPAALNRYAKANPAAQVKVVYLANSKTAAIASGVPTGPNLAVQKRSWHGNLMDAHMQVPATLIASGLP